MPGNITMAGDEPVCVAPRLSELKTRPCSIEELQAALIQLIELHNGMHDIIAMIARGRILSTKDAIMNTPYGI